MKTKHAMFILWTLGFMLGAYVSDIDHATLHTVVWPSIVYLFGLYMGSWYAPSNK